MAFVLRKPPQPDVLKPEAILLPEMVPAVAAKPARPRRVRHPGVAREVRGLRERHGLSQAEFGRRFGFELDTIWKCEQGHRQPTGPARSLLRIIAAEPEAVTRALAQQDASGR